MDKETALRISDPSQSIEAPFLASADHQGPMSVDTNPSSSSSNVPAPAPPLDPASLPPTSPSDPSTSLLDGSERPSGSGESSSIQVFGPAATPSEPNTPSELDSSFFEPTLSDIQAHHASVLARSKRLNEAPLLTSKYRDADKLDKEKRKAEKWPNTTIRVKFSDGTQIQQTFPSSSPIQPVYHFVRDSLDPSVSSQPFMLWQPPRYQYPEHPVPSAKKPTPHRTQIVTASSYGSVKGGPASGLQGGTGGKETLSDLGLVPQSVLLVRWDEESMNATGYRAPLRPDLLDRLVPLPPTVPKDQAASSEKAGKAAGGGGDSKAGEKKIPKWLQKGLMKRK